MPINFDEFLLDYHDAHPWMTNTECVTSAKIAYDRYLDQPLFGDTLQWWMQDTMLELDTKRALARIS